MKKTIRLLISLTHYVSPHISARAARELLFRPYFIKKTKRKFNFYDQGRSITFASKCRGRVFQRGNEVVWLVHGWQSSGTRFKNLIELLLNNNYTVIIWDGPAHGSSPGRRTNLAHFSRCLHQDLQDYSSYIKAVIGHSFGGAATAFASSIGINCGKIVLISSPSDALGVFKRFWEVIGLKEKSCRIFVEIVEREMGLSLERLSSKSFINSIRQDLLIIHDTQDRVIPVADAKNLKELRPSLKLYLTNGYGHFKIVDSQETNNEILEFIASRKGDFPEDITL